MWYYFHVDGLTYAKEATTVEQARRLVRNEHRAARSITLIKQEED